MSDCERMGADNNIVIADDRDGRPYSKAPRQLWSPKIKIYFREKMHEWFLTANEYKIGEHTNNTFKPIPDKRA